MLAGFPLSKPLGGGLGGNSVVVWPAYWPMVNAVTEALEVHDSDQSCEVVLDGDAITIDDAAGKAEFGLAGPFIALVVSE